jgi:hypothetical protein
MSILVRQVINQAYQLAGVLDSDETADGSDGALAVQSLNELIGQLNIDQLLPFSQQVETYTVATNKNAYTIGLDTSITTPDILATSPSYVERILYQTSSNTRPMNIQGIDLPDLLSVANSQLMSTPSCFAVNETYPNSTIYFDCSLVPGCILTIVYNKAFPEYNINDTISAPSAFSELFVTGLSRKLCVLKKMPAETLQSIDILWKEAKSRIQRNNGRRQTPLMNMGVVQNGYSYDATWSF